MKEVIREAYSWEYFSVYPPFPCFSPLVVGFVLLRIVYFLVSEAQTREKSRQLAALVGYNVDLGSIEFLEAGRRSPYAGSFCAQET